MSKFCAMRSCFRPVTRRLVWKADPGRSLLLCTECAAKLWTLPELVEITELQEQARVSDWQPPKTITCNLGEAGQLVEFLLLGELVGSYVYRSNSGMKLMVTEDDLRALAGDNTVSMHLLVDE